MLPGTTTVNTRFGAVLLVAVCSLCSTPIVAAPPGTQVSGQSFRRHVNAGCRQPISADPAMTWTQLPAPFANGYQHPVSGITVDPNGILYVSGRTDVARSGDGGRTWTTIRQGQPPDFIIGLGLNSKNEPVIGVTEMPEPKVYNFKGVYRYSGRYWRQANGITANRQVSAFALDRTGALIAVTAWHGDVFRSSDDGNNFALEAANIGQDGALWTVAQAPDGSLFAGGECTHGIYRSTDNGRSWVSLGLHTADGYKGNIYAIGFTATGDPLIGRAYNSGASELQRYTAGHWISASNGLPPYRTVICVVTAANGDLFASAAASKNTGCGVYRSTDNGATWTDFSTGLPPGSQVTRLALDKSGNLYVLDHTVTANAVYTMKLGH